MRLRTFSYGLAAGLTLWLASFAMNPDLYAIVVVLLMVAVVSAVFVCRMFPRGGEL